MSRFLRVRLVETTSTKVRPGEYLFRWSKYYADDGQALDRFELANPELKKTCYKSAPVLGTADEWGRTGIMTMSGNTFLFECL